MPLRYPRVLIRRNGEYLRKRKYPQIPAKRPHQIETLRFDLMRRSSGMNELWPTGAKRTIWSLRRRAGRELCEALVSHIHVPSAKRALQRVRFICSDADASADRFTVCPSSVTFGDSFPQGKPIARCGGDGGLDGSYGLPQPLAGLRNDGDGKPGLFTMLRGLPCQRLHDLPGVGGGALLQAEGRHAGKVKEDIDFAPFGQGFP